jgi:hypothetical protein
VAFSLIISIVLLFTWFTAWLYRIEKNRMAQYADDPVRNTLALLQPFCSVWCKNDHFTKTGSGQTLDTMREKGAFSADVWAG